MAAEEVEKVKCCASCENLITEVAFGVMYYCEELPSGVGDLVWCYDEENGLTRMVVKDTKRMVCPLWREK